MNYSYDCEAGVVIEDNILQFFKSKMGVYSMKMDEIAISQRIRWSPDNDEVVGFCYNHKRNLTMKFSNYLNLTELKEGYDSKKLHLAKETLCITVGAMGTTDIVPKPIILIPTCCKTLPALKSIITNIKESFDKLIPNGKILNLATDGDHYRRKIFNEMRQSFKVLQSLTFFNSDLVLGDLTVNF